MTVRASSEINNDMAQSITKHYILLPRINLNLHVGS